MDSDGDDDDDSSSIGESEDASPTKNWARTRTLSISSPAEHTKIAANLATTTVPKELTLDYAEISAVPPLPLWLLLAADQGSANLGEPTSGADSLFHPSLQTHVNYYTFNSMQFKFAATF